jgi:molybdopterin molybdotransferase
MAGARDPFPRTTTAILGEDLPANDHRQDYLRALTRDGHVFAGHTQDSSMLLMLARADCLIVRAPGAPALSAGEPVEILPFA